MCSSVSCRRSPATKAGSPRDRARVDSAVGIDREVPAAGRAEVLGLLEPAPPGRQVVDIQVDFVRRSRELAQAVEHLRAARHEVEVPRQAAAQMGQDQVQARDPGAPELARHRGQPGQDRPQQDGVGHRLEPTAGRLAIEASTAA